MSLQGGGGGPEGGGYGAICTKYSPSSPGISGIISRAAPRFFRLSSLLFLLCLITIKTVAAIKNTPILIQSQGFSTAGVLSGEGEPP